MSDEAVLHARARELARPLPVAAVDGMLDVLAFRLGHERYAVEMRHVREVYPLKELTPLPATPRFVRGVVNVRGRIVAVLDLRELLDLPQEGFTDFHHVVVVEGQGLEPGLLADSVIGVQRVPLDALQPALATLGGIREEFLKGIGPEHLVVLDVDRMLSHPALVIDQDADAARSSEEEG